MNLQKPIIFLGLLLDVIGIAIIIPAFPELKIFYGISDFQVTMGLTIYSLFAFLSAPVLGQLSDKYGRKGLLVGCVFGTFLSYLVLLLTRSYWVFIVSRIINGITGGNISILQAILTDISPDEETKQKNFGVMGAFFGLGFIIGPLLGALMLKFGGVENIFILGLVLSAIEVILLYVAFKNTNTPHPEKHLSFNSFVIMGKYIKNPDLFELLLSLGLLGIGGFIINVGLGLHMQNLFGTSGEQYGYYLAISGVIAAINFGFLIRAFWMKYFSHRFLISLAHLVMIAGYMMLSAMHEKFRFLCIFYLTITLGAIYAPVYNIEIMSAAPKDKIGEVAGMLGGMQSLFMFLGPLIGGVLLAQHISIFYGTVVCALLSLVVMVRRLMRG